MARQPASRWPRPMSRLARRVCTIGPGSTVGLEHRLHVGQQPGPVERLQAQRHEVLVVRRACRRRCRRQQHAPPQPMQRRRARRQLEARQQLLERLEVEPAPKLERQARGVGRHDGRQLALLDPAAARRGPGCRLLAGRLGWSLARRWRRPARELASLGRGRRSLGCSAFGLKGFQPSWAAAGGQSATGDEREPARAPIMATAGRAARMTFRPPGRAKRRCQASDAP